MNFSYISNIFSSSSDTKDIANKDELHIVMILDESGSMNNIKYEMIKSINSFINEQKDVEGKPVKFTFVKFNNRINRIYNRIPLKECPELTEYMYTPNSTTALYDAIGDTINWFNKEKNVLMVIVTDGQENASKEYSKSTINNMISDKEKNNNWSYVYLSSDLSTKTQGDNIGLQKSIYKSNCVVAQEKFSDFLHCDLNNAVKNYRCKGVSVQKQLNNKF